MFKMEQRGPNVWGDYHSVAASKEPSKKSIAELNAELSEYQSVAKVKACDKTILDSLTVEMATPLITLSALKALRSLAKSRVVAINVGASRTRK